MMTPGLVRAIRGLNSLLRVVVLLAVLVALLAGVMPAHAQTTIVAAAPQPGAAVSVPPTEVRLTFNRPLLEEGTSLVVANAAGERVDNQDGHIDPANRFMLVVTLPLLAEGQYTVAYTIASVGSSTILQGSYQFSIDLPDPVVSLVVPRAGQVFEPGAVPVEFQTEYVDFSLYDSRIRLYVDDQLYTELRELKSEIRGLTVGVHEIRTVLTRFDGQELPETSSTIYIVIAHPDPEIAGREAAAIAPPDPGLQLAPLQLAGVIAATLILLALGVWLGRSTGNMTP